MGKALASGVKAIHKLKTSLSLAATPGLGEEVLLELL